MDEETAKTKWCPFARVVGHTGDQIYPASNRAVMLEDGAARWNDNPEPARCIGSACMAWRVAEFPAQQENSYGSTEPPEGDGWRPSSTGPRNQAWWRMLAGRSVGFCGLAGAPQP